MHTLNLGFPDLLTAWLWSPFSIAVAVGLAGFGYWYLRAERVLSARGRRWPAARAGSFLGGLVMVELALGSPVATFTNQYFEAHVIQHLLLMVGAPALLALGAPSTLLLQTASRRTKLAWLKALRSTPFAVLTHPISVAAIYLGVMFVFFLTPLINTAMLHMGLMDALNLGFLLGGCLYWWPMVGKDPIVHWKMGYGANLAALLVGGAMETFLGVVILMQRTPIASMYSLTSTHAGGALFWISTELLTVGGMVPIVVSWMRSDQRDAARADARLEGSAGSGGRAPTGPVFQVAAASPEMTTWESVWLARTGSVPAWRGPQVAPAGAAPESPATTS